MSIHGVTILHHQQPLGPSGEADHRIANSLAAISGLVRVRARAADDVADPKTFLLEIADRIDTVAKLHRLLAYSNSGNVRLISICKKFATGSAARSQRTGRFIQLTVPLNT